MNANIEGIQSAQSHKDIFYLCVIFNFMCIYLICTVRIAFYASRWKAIYICWCFIAQLWMGKWVRIDRWCPDNDNGVAGDVAASWKCNKLLSIKSDYLVFVMPIEQITDWVRRWWYRMYFRCICDANKFNLDNTFGICVGILCHFNL